MPGLALAGDLCIRVRASRDVLAGRRDLLEPRDGARRGAGSAALGDGGHFPSPSVVGAVRARDAARAVPVRVGRTAGRARALLGAVAAGGG
eukprot:6044910-Pleurochrysis_carterae.AAC.2